MKCYECKREAPDDAQFCPACGSPQRFTRELIDRAIDSDQEAITQLYNMTKDNVYYTIKTMISDEDMAQDLTQDAFLKAMGHLGQLNEPAAFRGWIKTIARNMTIDALRRKKVIFFTQMVSSDSDEAIEFEDDRQENLPEVVIDRQETARLLGEILGSLSAEQRVVTEMFYYEGFSVKEIARELGVSENTVKSRLKYARGKIEAGVLELEKKGTKLYSLAPIPFLLLLLRSQDAYAAELPDADILQAIRSEGAAAGAKDGLFEQAADSGAGAQKAAKAARAGAGALSKGIVTKILAGVVAAALIGGAVAGILARGGEEEPPEAQEEPEAQAAVTARDFEGYYTSPDTDIGLTVTPLDDESATVVLEDVSPAGAEPFYKEGPAVLDGETLTMDLETGGGRAVLALSGNRVIVRAPMRYQTDVDRDISGAYAPGERPDEEEEESQEPEETQEPETADMQDYIGTFMNGNGEAGRLTVSENDPQSVHMRLEAFRNLGDQELSTIFDSVGHPFENGIYVEVSGQRIEFTKGDREELYILDVPETLQQEWNITRLNYENPYVRVDEVPEATPEQTAEIERFLGTYTKDYGSYSIALILSTSEEDGLLHYSAGNSYHGGWMGNRYTEYSIQENELRAVNENGTDTFVLNEDGSITATLFDAYNNGTYISNDDYDETEEYPNGYP